MGVRTALAAWFGDDPDPVVRRAAYLLVNRVPINVWIPLPDGREIPATVLDVVTQSHDNRVDTTLLFTTDGNDRQAFVCSPYREIAINNN